MSGIRFASLCAVPLLALFCGCGSTARDLALDQDLAHSALDKALNAWVAGKKPTDLKPEIIVTDAAWNNGSALVSFEVKTANQWSDGTNLYLPVTRKLKDAGGKVSTGEMTYVVGTSPVITIFPQE